MTNLNLELTWKATAHNGVEMDSSWLLTDKSKPTCSFGSSNMYVSNM